MTQVFPDTTRTMNRKQRRQAARSAKRGKPVTAVQGFTVSGRAGDANPTFRKAAQHHRAGKLDRAEVLYREVLGSDPENLEAMHMLGGLLATRGKHEEAIERLTAVLARTPDSPQVHYNLAFAYSVAGQDERAAQGFQDALRLKPDYFDALKGLAAIGQKANNPSVALAPLRTALEHSPDDAILHKMTALLLQTLGQHPEALVHFQKVSSLCPDDTEARVLLAISHRELGQFDEAVAVMAHALSEHPDDQEVRSRLACFLCDGGQAEAALPLAVEAITKAPDLPIAHSALAGAVQFAAMTDYDEGFEKALCTAFDRNHCRHFELGRPAVNTLRQKYNQVALQQQRQRDADGEDTTGPQAIRLDGIMTDGLLLRTLNQTKVPDQFFEKFLTSVRRAVLQATPNQPSLPAEARRFLAALARHCHENSYAYFMADDEKAAVQILKSSLRHEIERLPDSLPVLEIRLTLIALYEPLVALSEASELGGRPIEHWSEDVRELIKAALYSPLEERQIQLSIESITEIEDEVSKKVQAQYESNPYPRWWHTQTPTPVAFVRGLNLEIPTFQAPAFLNQPLEFLVAGCGTGQHPISIARHTLNCKILAVDLSRASLAYAIRKAEEVDVPNIEFKHGDILSLSCLDRQFPVIECAGVLHHMKEPEAGLATLVDLLRPNGVMKLGLYSEIARAPIVAARAKIEELGLSSQSDDIRAFRQRVLRREETDEALVSLLDSADFYDLDGARDLLFHVQEHRYTIPELQDLLERQGLRFLGFTFPSTGTKRAYAERFPNDPDMVDLSLWNTFEEENPHTFRSMYQFWCQKVA